MRIVIVFAAFAALGTSPVCGAHPNDQPVGWPALYRLDLLPQLRTAVEIGSVSSYDRTGGNDDGFSGKYSFVAKEDDGLVIADLQGPGVIYRIWTPTPSDDVMEFYFDGEKTPRIRVPFRGLFTGANWPFVGPMVGRGVGGFYSYIPIGYRKRCRIKVRGQRVQFYQINYARYAPEAPIETWQQEPSADYQRGERLAAAVFGASGTDVTASVTPPGAKTTTVQRRVTLQPGATAPLFSTDHGGRIIALRIGPTSALGDKQRSIMLRAFWDGESKPAILCPVADFFGYAWGRPSTTSLLVGTAGNTAYSYFPMPFECAARVELVSTRETGPPIELVAEITTADLPRGDNEGRFYAVWRRENPTDKGQPFTFVDTKGRGHIVGCVLQAQGMVSGNTYFFEGDDATYIDGKLAIHGTGSEDFFNGGWYDVPGRWEQRQSFPLSGCLGYMKHLGRTGGYRLMLGDAYSFRMSIRQTIEHAPTENSLLTDYCSVTYLYLADPPDWDGTIASPERRRVADFRRIVFTPGWSTPIHAFAFRDTTLTKKEEKIGAQRVRYLSLRCGAKDMFGQPFIALTCDVPAAGRYRVSIAPVRGPESAQVQLFANETPVGKAVDLYASDRQIGTAVVLGKLELAEGPTHVMLKVVGRNENATAYGLDLVTLQLERID